MENDNAARPGEAGDNSWMLTASGIMVNFLDPQTHNFILKDITNHTSKICRFTGATSDFYSVAQHSVFVGLLIQQGLDKEGADKAKAEYWDQILAGLLHDAEEAYTHDLSSPLKCCIRGRYNWIATGIRRKIFERYGVDWGYYNEIVKAADNVAIEVERFYLMPYNSLWPKALHMPYPRPPVKTFAEAEMDFYDALRITIECRNQFRSSETVK